MVTFNFSYAPGTTLQQMIGFETAGRIWASYLTDNVTVNLYVGVSSDLPSNVIGGTLPGIKASQSYLSVYNSLQADATSADDKTAMQSLRWGTTFAAWFDMFANGINQGQPAYTQTVNLTQANAKALGITPANATGLDGVILFGSLSGSGYNWSYDYTRSTTPASNSLDFLSTALHEIGHALGIVSSVDAPGVLNSTINLGCSPGGTDLSTYINNVDQRVTYATPLDFFRFSKASSNLAMSDLSYGSKGGSKYLSLNNGFTSIAQFSTGIDKTLGGSGDQASHWSSGTNGIMAPSLAPNQRLSVSSVDLRALDVIGWTLAPNATNLSLNLSTLVGQSLQALASRLGQSVAGMNANTSVAAQSLTQDRSQDIGTMVQNSQIYNWGKGGGNPYSQVVSLMSQQQVYTSFETLDASSPTGNPVQEVTPSNSSSVQPTLSPDAPTNDISLTSTPPQLNQLIQPIVRAIAPKVTSLDNLGKNLNLPTNIDPNNTQWLSAQLVNISSNSQPPIQQNSLTAGQNYYKGSSVRKDIAPSQSPSSSKPWEKMFDLNGVLTPNFLNYVGEILEDGPISDWRKGGGNPYS
jgi:hypothetical protein